MRKERLCSVENCGRKHNAKGYCKAHYHKLVAPQNPQICWPCSFPDCPNLTKGARVYCNSHDMQKRRAGILKPLHIPANGCRIEGCDRAHASGGLCQPHSIRKKRGIDELTMQPIPLRQKHSGNEVCAADGCLEATFIKNWCGYHYQRQLRGIPFQRTRPQVSDWGDRKIYPNGYVYIKVKDRGSSKRRHWQQEHRYVMEQALGRSLTEDETVHHKNGIRDDNRIENLELWSKSQPYGQRVADKLEWAKAFIARYENTQLELEE